MINTIFFFLYTHNDRYYDYFLFFFFTLGLYISVQALIFFIWLIRAVICLLYIYIYVYTGIVFFFGGGFGILFYYFLLSAHVIRRLNTLRYLNRGYAYNNSARPSHFPPDSCIMVKIPWMEWGFQFDIFTGYAGILTVLVEDLYWAKHFSLYCSYNFHHYTSRGRFAKLNLPLLYRQW